MTFKAHLKSFSLLQFKEVSLETRKIFNYGSGLCSFANTKSIIMPKVGRLRKKLSKGRYNTRISFWFFFLSRLYPPIQFSSSLHCSKDHKSWTMWAQIAPAGYPCRMINGFWKHIIKTNEMRGNAVPLKRITISLVVYISPFYSLFYRLVSVVY